MTGIYSANHSVAHSQFIFASQQSGTSRFTQPERPFIMFRKLLSTALLTSFSGLAMADGGDSNIEQFMASQPHAAGISNGTAVIVDNQGGQPVIAYHGAASQGGAPGWLPSWTTKAASR
ncbi:hypothetical protein ACFQU7_37485 [Pseudoroseomonas wenyumeiae]